jgi:hypothetical protein
MYIRCAFTATGNSRALMSTTLHGAIADTLDQLDLCEQDRGQFVHNLVKRHARPGSPST